MKIQTLYAVFLLIFIFASASCINDKQDSVDPATPPKEIITEYILTPPDLEFPSIKSGLYGRHLKWKRLPAPSHVVTVPPYGYGEFFPVTNDLYIFPPLTYTQLKAAIVENIPSSYYIDKIAQKPFYIITPNKNGFYQIDLPKGMYTAFMKADDSTLYGSMMVDGYDHTMPVIIDKDQLLERDFLLDIEQNR